MVHLHLGPRETFPKSVVLIYCTVLARLTTAQMGGYCQFPDFLWEAHEGSREPVWVTRTEYINVTSDWTMEEEIKVNPTDITVTVATRESCRDSRQTTCEDKRVYETAICLSEEPDGKYRVKIDRRGKTLFTCVRFIKRNANIVQIWAAKEQHINEDKLCHENSLERVPWPWIAREKVEWSFCPLVGGFDFKAKMSGTKKTVCARHLRPSRLESECIRGEGIYFSFPEDRCSIFPPQFPNPKLYCWGSWTEDEYTFVVLGRETRTPQYTLRIPREMTASRDKNYTAYLYYSPVCPVRNRGRPPGQVTYAELTMATSAKGVCYDESPECTELMGKGKCTNEALHKFANYCKKSCGLCGRMGNLVPSVEPECFFPKEWRGDWLWAESGALEDVTIGPGQVSFSQLGNFLCKNRHPDNHKYKMMSYYSNGCRPRYTCMQFRREGKILRFQISKSDMADRSFDLCNFGDDPAPLGDQIRSANMKVLLPKTRTKFNSCGLFGELNVNVTFPFDSSCRGSVNDWDKRRCKPKTILNLSVYPCSHFDWREYVCVAYSIISDDYSVVLTRAGESPLLPLQCWVVHRTYSPRLERSVWADARLLDTGQCGYEPSDQDRMVGTGAVLEFKRTSDHIENTCFNPQRPHFTKIHKPMADSEQDHSKETTLSGHKKVVIAKTTILPKTTLEAKESKADQWVRDNDLPDSSWQNADPNAAGMHSSATRPNHSLEAFFIQCVITLLMLNR